jgi:hypothetical protein
MYKSRYIQYINFPKIPQEIINGLPIDITNYQTQKNDNYHWTDSHNETLNCWCQENICRDAYFAFQLITGDLPKHKDIGTKTKFVYVLETGGSAVYTRFWDDNFCLLDEYIIEKNKWHILKADTHHSVTGIEPGLIRWSVTARIF